MIRSETVIRDAQSIRSTHSLCSSVSTASNAERRDAWGHNNTAGNRKMKSFAEAGARSPGTAWDTLVQAVLSLVVGLTLMATASQAKIAGSTHCYNGVCHRVWTVEETRAAINPKFPNVQRQNLSVINPL